MATVSPYSALPGGSFSSGSSNNSSSSGPGMIPGMGDIYNQLLGLNQNNYNNILNSYGFGQQNLASQLPGIYASYGNTLQGVQTALGQDANHPWGVALPAAQAIGQQFGAQTGAQIDPKTGMPTNAPATGGQILSNATSRGLGNTTVPGNLLNQASLYAGQAYGSLGSQLAQTYAGYLSQIGLAQSAARMQGLGMQTNLAGQQGNALAGYRFQNTAGPLSGQFGTSFGNSMQSSASRSLFGGGGTGGGGGGGRQSAQAGTGYRPSGPDPYAQLSNPGYGFGTQSGPWGGGGGGGGYGGAPASYGYDPGGGGFSEPSGASGPADNWSAPGDGGGGADFGGDTVSYYDIPDTGWDGGGSDYGGGSYDYAGGGADYGGGYDTAGGYSDFGGYDDSSWA